MKSLSCVQLFVTSWTVACQTPLSIEFPRQDYWSGLPFSSLGDLPKPGIEPTSPASADRFFTAEPPGKLNKIKVIVFYLGCERDKKWRDSGCAVSLRVGEK